MSGAEQTQTLFRCSSGLQFRLLSNTTLDVNELKRTFFRCSHWPLDTADVALRSIGVSSACRFNIAVATGEVAEQMFSRFTTGSIPTKRRTSGWAKELAALWWASKQGSTIKHLIPVHAWVLIHHFSNPPHRTDFWRRNIISCCRSCGSRGLSLSVHINIQVQWQASKPSNVPGWTSWACPVVKKTALLSENPDAQMQ
jgi:hypothetical protein